MFVPRAVITRAEGHVSFSPPGHQSLEELVARLGLESMLHGSCLQQKQNPSRSLLGAAVRASQLWLKPGGFCAVLPVQGAVLAPDTYHRLLLPGSNSALAPLAWDHLLFRFIAGVLLQTLPFASAPQLCTDRSPSASLAAPSQHSFPID